MNQPHYITDYIVSAIGNVPRVSGILNHKDILGAIMVRWSINRNSYRVDPGLYALGNPSATSDVFVTANYKLSFDHLRKNLNGLDAWILVLDTRGINVWCAAGKGTFSTKELVNRIRAARLDELISHRRIIVPQLGAVGISAHQVKKQTEMVEAEHLVAASSVKGIKRTGVAPVISRVNSGFNIVFGPVRARDIRNFIKNKYVATPEMRRVTFTFTERATLIPVDFVYGKYKLLIAFAVFFLLSGVSGQGYSFDLSLDRGPSALLYIFLSYAAGIIFTPLALPYIPGRSFALKGFFAGSLVFLLLLISDHPGKNGAEWFSWFFTITGISSFVAMNFTGSSTYTSLSGVKKEMKLALPLQVAFVIAGLVLFVLSKLI